MLLNLNETACNLFLALAGKQQGAGDDNLFKTPPTTTFKFQRPKRGKCSVDWIFDLTQVKGKNKIL